MLCDEEAFYRAYLEHKAKVDAEAAARDEARPDAAPPFAADAAEPADKRKTNE
jgi:hypothetical protein